MTPRPISFEEADPVLDWIALSDALRAGHSLPRAELNDVLLQRGSDSLLNRSAWIDGLGICVKAATIFPGNAAFGDPTIDGGVLLLDDKTGAPRAILDFKLVTKWKTAGDSLLAARILARPDSRDFLICGAGTVARNLVDAYSAAFPAARFTIWNRTPEKAEAFAKALDKQVDIRPATDLAKAVAAADSIASATMTIDPIIKGEWLQPGQHLDLIGAFRPDMREADDAALQRGRLFVDSRDTTIHHIGELMRPIAAGAISAEHVVADYYDIPGGGFARHSPEDITIFKNGGGGHLDLMTAFHILETLAATDRVV